MLSKFVKTMSGVLILTFIFSSAMAKNDLDSLQLLEWKNRVILINNVTSKELINLQSSKALEPLAERYIYWFAFSGGKVLSNYPGSLHKKFQANLADKYSLNTERNREKRVLLIGYDGYVKLRQSRLNLDFIYETIDGMPMRQREMLNQ